MAEGGSWQFRETDTGRLLFAFVDPRCLLQQSEYRLMSQADAAACLPPEQRRPSQLRWIVVGHPWGDTNDLHPKWRFA